MAALTVVYVSSLQSSCIRSVADHVQEHQKSLHLLPNEVKDKLVKLFSKRGLLNDEILPKVVTSHIRELDLSESSPTDVGLATLSQCKGLKKLDLNAVKDRRENISSEGIINVVKCCTKLQTVYLRRCVNITDIAIKELAHNCPYIQHLNIAACNIMDESLKALANNCRYLQSLNVCRTKITDDGVMSLANGCCAASLKELHVAHCTEISDDSLEAILMLCPKICILIFHGCPLVTERLRYAMDEVIERGGKMRQVSWTVY
ncbi:protein AMN1 homolog [Actinia tenebrosa]|uniref:Protein AMN1 homolog n=1 Tax=Actinia tenebrosa TaxID=6105 RepID=A0A6P8IGP5_ACTTE|nr:protein AMN1 homolog [Actinia tenebrosa]